MPITIPVHSQCFYVYICTVGNFGRDGVDLTGLRGGGCGHLLPAAPVTQGYIPWAMNPPRALGKVSR
jgi:hypothetical protein